MIARETRFPRIAAFFDVDGTLLAAPSLERRLFATLRAQRAIPAQNYLRWLAHAVRVAPSGWQAILHTNKMYLRGISSTDIPVCGYSSQGQAASVNPTRPTSLALFAAAIDQAAWHAFHNHAIVLVSGTLAPLAHQVAVALTATLAARDLVTQIGVCATRLETINNRYTGRIAGQAIFGPAKAEAIRRIAAEQGFDLRRSYAYGDTHNDRWMLGFVGRPAAVNPTKALERVARLNDWPVLRWTLSSPAQHAGSSQHPVNEATEPFTSHYGSVASACTESRATGRVVREPRV